jgi:7-cyano-7-deazaguanine synthase
MVVQVAPKIKGKWELTREKAVVLLSGGMDSTTLLYQLKRELDVYPITFYYGQRHVREVDAALSTCKKLGLQLKLVDIGFLKDVAPSALTRPEEDIPKGHYEDISMRKTVVPNRNMVFISIATSYAIGIGADVVAYGAHGGDHAIYPDCRPAFVDAMNKVLDLCDYKEIYLEVPYLYFSKEDILRKGIELGVDYSLTWTCYEGKKLACGKCGSCIERLEAFRNVGIKDPIEYEEVK